ncbi:leucine-rich repeat domain-containing protein [Butyrivibrio sp. FC2001]|uniref:leucine-rich repeat domain-containing protein n=1 Tax=Butyrivibrio sp. FC2001 TaxID=1280671 RepID=UPI00047A31D0|nr:leucine-rich repeat domain-containing protein [Butyrivibrio sp. FC2001]
MSERKKSNNKMIKRILSGVMAFAIALSMCMVAMPTRVLADEPVKGGFWVNDGKLINTTPSDPTKNVIYAQGVDVIDPTTIMEYSNNTLKIKKGITIDASIDGLWIAKPNQTIELSENNTFYLVNIENTANCVTIKMTQGSSVEIKSVTYYDPSPSTPMSLQEAVTAKHIKVENGKIEDTKIVYDGDTPTPDPDPTPSDIKVDDEVSEKGKTPAEAPTYKVTKKDGNTGEITYEKPATDAANVKETEEIPSEVVLGDGNTYKVTKVAKRAFADAPGKEKIKEIKVGENVDEIGEEACKGLPSLEKVNLGKNVKKIDKGAFANCGKLKKADLPADLEEVGESAFERTNLPSAKFGKKVKKVGRKAYYKCKKFKKLTVKSKKLTKKSRVAKNAFAGTNKKFKVKVKISNAKTKAATINVFKQKKIGYKPTWTVN